MLRPATGKGQNDKKQEMQRGKEAVQPTIKRQGETPTNLFLFPEMVPELIGKRQGLASQLQGKDSPFPIAREGFREGFFTKKGH